MKIVCPPSSYYHNGFVATRIYGCVCVCVCFCVSVCCECVAQIHKDPIANLNLESHEPHAIRRWYRKLCHFFKIIKNQSPKYLFELIPTARQAYMTRHKNSALLFNVKHDFFKNSSFNCN